MSHTQTFLIPIALLAAASLKAQAPIQTLSALLAQTPPSKSIVPDPFTTNMIMAEFLGKTICGHPIDDATVLDAFSFSAPGKMAFAIRWLDPRPGTIVHSAIFTGFEATCLVTDGAIVDGRFITRAMPNSLAVSDKASFAWEGEYVTSPAESIGGSRPHRGAFIGNGFAFEIDQKNATPATNPDLSKKDFIWSKEVLVPRPGAVLAVSPIIPIPVKPAVPPLQKAGPVAPTASPNARAQRPNIAPKVPATALAPKAAAKAAVTAPPKAQRVVIPCPPFCHPKH